MKKRPATVASSVAAAIAIAIVAALFVAGNNNDILQDKTIRLGYFPVVGHAIPIVGMERGIFGEYMPSDVRIKTMIFDSGPQVVESMFAGSLDLAYVGPGPAINAFLNSEDGSIRVLSGAASGGTSFVMHPSADSLHSFDFAHKKIAAPQIGNTQDVSLRHYIVEQGLQTTDKGGTVTVYNIPNPDIVTLFVKGEIDGAWVSEPWATMLVEEYDGVRLFQEEELWPNGEFATVLLIADTNYVSENPALISKWLDAHQNIAQIINLDKDAAGLEFNNFLSKHFGQQLDSDVVRISVHNTKVTTSPLKDTVYEFAQRADALGYMGRGAYDLSELFFENNATATSTIIIIDDNDDDNDDDDDNDVMSVEDLSHNKMSLDESDVYFKSVQ